MFLGYVLEIILYDSHDFITFETKFYLTHMDIAIGNTFITTSGFIILLLTIDRWDDCLENKKVTFKQIIIKNINHITDTEQYVIQRGQETLHRDSLFSTL